MARVRTYNIDGAIAHINDEYVQSPEESEKALKRYTDIVYKALYAQHNAERMKKMKEQKDETA